MESLIHDLRFSLRSLRRRPGFTVIAVATVALGIGVNVAIFSVVHSVLLRSLPYRDPERVVHVLNRSNTVPRLAVGPRDFVDYQEQATLFEGLGAMGMRGDATLTGGDEPAHAILQFATDNLFSLLGFEPALGRGFLPEDAALPGSQEETDSVPSTQTLPGTILSHGLWQRYFGGDPDIIGQTVEVNNERAHIVGVMPEDFAIVPNSERVREAQPDLWFPFFYDFREVNRRVRNLLVFGRLKTNVTVEQARAQMDGISRRLQEEFPEYQNQNLQIQVLPARHDTVKSVRPALLMLSGAVGFLLLLSCANVANLLLLRARTRLSEVSVRGALGCGPRRLARQILIECLVLAGAGGLVGLALAWLGIRLLMTLKPADLPRFEAVSLNGPVLAFSLGVSMLAAVLVGLLPAIQAGRINLVEGLKDQAQGSVGGRRSRLLGSLVVAEVALSLVLLLGAGLMIRTSVALQAIRPGFVPEGALTLSVNLYDEKYFESGPQTRIAFFQELEERLRALAGVEEVGSTNWVPLSGGGGVVTGYAWDEDSEARWPAARANFRVVTGDYFRAIGTRLLVGRSFSELELTEPTPSVIVDELLAGQSWPGEDPIGKSFVARQPENRVEVVGVVEHVRSFELREEGRGTIYFPLGAVPYGALKVIVRGSGDLGPLFAPIRQEIRSLDPGLAIHHVATLQDLFNVELAPTRFALVLMGIFAGLALALAAIGLYGVIAYSVSQRTAEIGIRMAFGADSGRVLRLVVGRGVALTAAGAVVGAAATFALSRFVASLVYGVSTADPTTMIVVALVLAAVGLLASYVPARRAAKVDPASALRAI
jgi:predicted permease